MTEKVNLYLSSHKDVWETPSIVVAVSCHGDASEADFERLVKVEGKKLAAKCWEIMESDSIQLHRNVVKRTR